jgi:hypothetical protein
MGIGRHWRRLVASWSGSGVAEEAREQPSHQALHQQQLRRMQQEGLPVWSELPPRCDACGRQLLTGERAIIVRSGEDLVLTCQLCEERLVA